jgi:aspartyl-tRNA(Asn)/glutamyl-tRNA(Gln) amidotransferase subunit C
MVLSDDEVRHVARLARLDLTEAELLSAGQQLSAILEHITSLQEVDVSGVEPTAQVTGLTTVWRDDAVIDALTAEQALANAPDRQDSYFRVRAVFDE